MGFGSYFSDLGYCHEYVPLVSIYKAVFVKFVVIGVFLLLKYGMIFRRIKKYYKEWNQEKCENMRLRDLSFEELEDRTRIT